jgi:hypothetical protein
MDNTTTIKYVLEIHDSWSEEFTDVQEAFKRFDEVRSPMGTPKLTAVTTITQDYTNLANCVHLEEQ